MRHEPIKRSPPFVDPSAKGRGKVLRIDLIQDCDTIALSRLTLRLTRSCRRAKLAGTGRIEQRVRHLLVPAEMTVLHWPFRQSDAAHPEGRPPRSSRFPSERLQHRREA